MAEIDVFRRLLLPSTLMLLVACWLGGGVTQDDTSIDEWLQLLALPVLAIAAMTLMVDWPKARTVQCGIVVALMVALVPALQLLPLPIGWWSVPAARQAMATDLAQAGVTALATHWSLSPAATEASLWSMLPALAGFFAALALPARQRRVLVLAIVLLVVFNVIFAFFQVSLPRDSNLRLYPDFDPSFGGLLVNTNHQATACIIGMVLAVGLAVESRLRAMRGEVRAHAWWGYACLAGCLLLVTPLSTARAGMAIALPALAAVLLLSGGLPLASIGRSKRTTALALGVVILAIVGVRAAMGWLAVDLAEEQRHIMAKAALEIGSEQAPLGSGIGSFVQVFEQAAPSSLWLAQYVNHAHNEYAQWWLTAGWLGMLVLACVLALLAVVGMGIARLRGRGSSAILAAASFVAVAVVLAHSWADYPLRTTTLMATTATLAGVMLAALADASLRLSDDRARRAARSADTATA